MKDPTLQWWPIKWADEVMPPARQSPDGFIITTQELGKPPVYRLGYMPEDHLPDHEHDYFQTPVAEGDIVAFICCDHLGGVEATINRDGNFVVDGLIDPRADHFYEPGNIDSLASTMAEFAQQHAHDNKHVQSWPIKVSVDTAWWSEALPHKLILTAHGPAFEPVSSAEARQ